MILDVLDLCREYVVLQVPAQSPREADPYRGSLPGGLQGPRAIQQQQGLRPRLQLPAGIRDEPGGEVRGVVDPWGRSEDKERIRPSIQRSGYGEEEDTPPAPG